MTLTLTTIEAEAILADLADLQDRAADSTAGNGMRSLRPLIPPYLSFFRRLVDGETPLQGCKRFSGHVAITQPLEWWCGAEGAHGEDPGLIGLLLAHDERSKTASDLAFRLEIEGRDAA